MEQTSKRLAETVTLQLEIFRSKKPAEFARVDKELELQAGEKERSTGDCDSMRVSTSVRWRTQALAQVVDKCERCSSEAPKS